MAVTVTIIINKLYREDRYNKWNYICAAYRVVLQYNYTSFINLIVY